MKLAIISVALPPSESGQSMVLFHLLKNIKSDLYCLITQKYKNSRRFQGNFSGKLPAKYYYLSPDLQTVQRIVKVLLVFRLHRLFDIILALRTYQIKRILLREKADVVIACTADLFDPPAAFSACKNLKIPFIFYIFDYYSHQWENPAFRAFAERHERDIVLGASGIFVPNEYLCEEYKKRYGVLVTTLHNPVDIVEYEHNARITPETLSSGVKIVYTGAVYEAHYSAFKNLVTAIKKINDPQLKLHLYTSQSPAQLGTKGIVGPVLLHQYQLYQNIPAIQRNANILFLPLAFNSIYPEIIKTSAPGKIGEYLASKKPILVHAPKNSFVSWYFKKYNCGLVVDEESPELLAQAIERLLTDKNFCQEITQNAYIRATSDFDIGIVQKKFQDCLKLTEK
jgi:glycosyltransferase involved in cell wall biosynthesis